MTTYEQILHRGELKGKLKGKFTARFDERSCGGKKRSLIDQLDDDADIAIVGRFEEFLEVVEVAIDGIDAVVVGNVIAIVPQGRGEEGQQPDRCDAQILDVVELIRQAPKVTDAIAIAIREGPHWHLIDDGVLKPQGIIREEGAGTGVHRIEHGGGNVREEGKCERR